MTDRPLDGVYTVTVDNRPGGKGTEVGHLGRLLDPGEARMVLMTAVEFLPPGPERKYDDLSRPARMS